MRSGYGSIDAATWPHSGSSPGMPCAWIWHGPFGRAVGRFHQMVLTEGPPAEGCVERRTCPCASIARRDCGVIASGGGASSPLYAVGALGLEIVIVATRRW